MERKISITKTEFQVIAEHIQYVQTTQHVLGAVYKGVLAHHGIAQGTVTAVSETELTVEVPDAPAEPAPAAPKPPQKSPRK